MGNLHTACYPRTAEWFLTKERIRRRIRKDLAESRAIGAKGSEDAQEDLKDLFGRSVHLRAPIFSMGLRISHV